MLSILFILALSVTVVRGNSSKGRNAALRASDFLSGNRTACDMIHPEELPQECTCTEPHGPYSLVIECNKKFDHKYFNDTIGMKIDVDPCNDEGSRISLDVTEKKKGIDYTITGIRAGEEKNIPIPGLSIVVPTVGHLGVDAAVLIAGNPDKLTLKVGLNACMAISGHKNLCASSVPGLNKVLPWYVLSGTYSFGEICTTDIGKEEASVAEE
mmetsp:Transcript_49863/g.149934  ORF Transcript_49863/g.149934 Transcript_49863/m.149934 type:complete len:212 (-) Transcript_49863:108-743(-)